MPQLKSKLIQKCKKETYATLKLSFLHWDLPWCLNLFFDASSSMFGVRLCAEEILRIEWRCSSVTQLLCVGLFNFITEKSCSHRYVLPNIESIWATWACSWGIVSGMKRGNCAALTASYFDLSVSLHWSSISSIWRLVGALSISAHAENMRTCIVG